MESQIGLFEQRMREVFSKTVELEMVMSLPGVGFLLGVVIVLEVGDVRRFPTASHLASYAGTTPRVHCSGGKTRYGHYGDVNRYLKWAYVEAANAICLHRRFFPNRRVSQPYDLIGHREGHQTARVGAVARHLAEATY